jgi:hypothetical protein
MPSGVFGRRYRQDLQPLAETPVSFPIEEFYDGIPEIHG